MTPEETKLAGKLAGRIAAALKGHDARCAHIDLCDQVYDGDLPQRENVWESQLHPPIAWQIIETIKANVIDERPTATVAGLTPQSEELADDFEKLIHYQRELDDFEEELSKFAHQGVIRPLTVAKVLWFMEVAPENKRSWQPPSEIGGQPVEVNTTEHETKARRASFLTLDSKDFWWNPGATDMRDARCVYHRTRETRETLEAYAEQGIYHNIDEIPKKGAGQGAEDNGDDQAPGDIEVIECWEKTNAGVWLSVLADRKVLIRSEASPLKHDELPFVVASISPRPFKFAGRSLAQVIADLQVAWWRSLNHFMDVVAHVANPAWRVDPQYADELTTLAPGQKVIAPAGSVEVLVTNTGVIAPLLEAMRVIVTIIQDLTAANPYSAGTADPSQVDQKTATEVSLIQTAAQRRLQEMKRQFSYALKRVGRQQIKLNQQLLDVPEAVRVVGDAKTVEWRIVDPSSIQGRFDYQIEDVAESINRQEKRTEATVKLQTLMGVAQLLPMLDPSKRVNLAVAIQKWSEAWGDDPDTFLEDAPPPMPILPSSPALAAGGAPAAPSPPLNGAGPAAAGGQLPIGAAA